MRTKKILSLVLAVAMVLGAMGVTALAADDEAYINGDVNTLMSVGDAVSKAKEGDTVYVVKNIDVLPLIDKAITIEGKNAEGASKIQIANGSAEKISVKSGIVTIKNFVYPNGGLAFSTENNSYVSENLTLQILNCDFENIFGNYAIQAGSTGTDDYETNKDDVLGSLIVDGCTFTASETVASTGYMLYAQCVKNVQITNNVFDGNYNYRAAIHLGDSVDYSTKAIVRKNTIREFSRGVQTGNRVSESSVALEDNEFIDLRITEKDLSADKEAKESGALFIHGNANASALDITVTNNKFTNLANPAIYSENASPVSEFVSVFANNTVNGADAGELEDNIPVSPASISGKGYDSLALAYEAAIAGDTIDLAGIEFNMSELSTDSVFYIKKAVTIKGTTGTTFNGSVRIESGNVTLDNIKFTNPVVIPYGDSEPICVDINTGEYANLTIKNSEFVTDAFAYENGKRYKGIVTSGSGLYKNLIIEDNVFTNLETAVHINPGVSDLKISGNTYTDNLYGTFVKLHGTNGAQITGNTASTSAIYVRPTFDNAPGKGINVSNNNFNAVALALDYDSAPVSDTINVSANYWGKDITKLSDVIYATADDKLEYLNLDSYYADVDAEGTLTNLVYIVDDMASVSKRITLEQVMNGETPTDKVEVYIEGYTNEGNAVIDNLVAVEIDFAVTGDFTVTDFVPASADWTYEVTANNSYLIRQKGAEDGAADLDGQKIHLGTLTLEGYGTGTLTAAGANDAVEQRSKDGENKVISSIAESVTLNFEIPVPKNDLTVNIEFNNAVNNNAKLYQDMKVIINGGDLTENIVVDLGADAESFVTYNGNYKIIIADKLTANRTYNVTVTGEGYRTARRNVTMTDDMTLTFWNNVKDVEGADYLAGDIVKDNKINIYDLSAVVSYFGTEASAEDMQTAWKYNKYDLNRDGKIDSKDVAYVLVSWGK